EEILKKYGGSGQGNASAAAAQPIKNGSSSEGKDDSGPTVTSPGGGWKRIGEAKDEDEEAPLLPSPVKPAVAAPELTTAPLNKLADEDFDMFSEDVDVADTSIVAEALKSNEGTDGHMVIGGREVTSLNTHTQLEEDVDDPEGYMKALLAQKGGAESNAVEDPSKEYKLVAIKVIRNNVSLLERIRKLPLVKRAHLLELWEHFEWRNHLCMVFEPLPLNLHETLNKFGKGVGISIAAVQTYARQLIHALDTLRELEVVHADIKPHNIMVNQRHTMVKLIDFGSAFRMTDPDLLPTPYLVILGLPYSPAVDLWSVGCVLYELYTGHIMFQGTTNNEMLWRFQEVKGRFPNRMVRKHLVAYEHLEKEPHFDERLRFKHVVWDDVSWPTVFNTTVAKRNSVRLKEITQPTKDLGAILDAKRAPTDDRRAVKRLKDLLEKIFMIDPAKRITVKEVIEHPFIKINVRTPEELERKPNSNTGEGTQ
ncbi:Prpf4b, partial [Symbiodinium sp. KB8]